MCGKSEIHICVNVSKHPKTTKLNILFQIQKKGKSINENYRNGKKQGQVKSLETN
jgi:hypothetical protein